MTGPKRIFITSDWHLGGRRDSATSVGTQICRSDKELAAFVGWVHRQADRDPGLSVELIVNGDMIDFLAPDDGYRPRIWLADQAAAIARLDQIVTEAPTPFAAMAEMLRDERCSITVLLGNHDIELSLPAVRGHLQSVILRNDGRGFEFFFDGEACGRGRLLVEHGNRYDALNNLDFSRLRQERSILSRGLGPRPEERNELFFLPPYGTHLVVEVFNPLLEACPFLNILKPELKAVLPLVLALHPAWLSLLRQSYRIFEVASETIVNRMRRPAQPNRPGLLAPSSAGASYRNFDALLEAWLGEDARAFLNSQPAESAGQQAAGDRSVQSRLDSLGERMTEAARVTIETIEKGLRIGNSFTDAARRRLGHCFLRSVRDGDKFSLDKEEPSYLNAARQLAREGGWQVVVFGHTHFAKDIPLEGGARYLNSGTWADVMRLPASDAGDDVAKDAALDEFIATMAARKLGDYLYRRLTFVDATVAEDGSVQAGLFEWNADSAVPLPCRKETS